MNHAKKVLIIEDEKQIIYALSKKLQKEGIKTLEARDGKTGLDLAIKERPDLILLDIILPEMDGLTVIEKLRESEEGKNVPVIILTNLEDSEEIQESRKKGVYDYLIKTDWSLEDVVGRVREALNKG